MLYRDMDEAIADYDELLSDVEQLLEVFRNDDNVDVYDWFKLHRFWDRMLYVRPKFFVYVNFLILIREVESEKDRFMIQKKAKYQEEDFFDNIESFIIVSKTWGLKDYRAINWQQRLLQFATDFKEYCIWLKKTLIE